MPYLKGDSPSLLEANVPKITQAYITSRYSVILLLFLLLLLSLCMHAVPQRRLAKLAGSQRAHNHAGLRHQQVSCYFVVTYIVGFAVMHAHRFVALLVFCHKLVGGKRPQDQIQITSASASLTPGCFGWQAQQASCRINNDKRRQLWVIIT
jgi:hypothetical protein